LLVNLLPHRLDLLFGERDLEGVVTGSDSLEIELFLLNVDRVLTVLDDAEKDQGGEDIHASGKESLLTLLGELIITNLAVVLDEDGVSLLQGA
jgi:hypothetical protein